MRSGKIVAGIGTVALGLFGWALGQLVTPLSWLPVVVAPVAGVALLLLGAQTVVEWRQDHSRKSLPGIGVHLVMRVGEAKERTREFYFDFGADGREGVSFYFSASGHFVFSVQDALGEAYPLEISSGWLGFPIAKTSLFSLEAGSDGRTTEIRASLNGRKVAHRQLPFSVNFGSLNPAAGAIFADRHGEHPSSATFGDVIVYSLTLSDVDLRQLVRAMLSKYGTMD